MPNGVFLLSCLLGDPNPGYLSAYWGEPERAPYRLVVDVNCESCVSGDERHMSGVYPESPTLRGTCNGGTSIARPVTSVAFPTKHGKSHTVSRVRQFTHHKHFSMFGHMLLKSL